MKPKSFLDQETSFAGKYSKEVFQTLYFAYRPKFAVMTVLIVIGFAGRILMLSNANLIGVWVDSMCKSPATCRPIPHFFDGYANGDFLHLLVFCTIAGFSLTAIFRVGFSRVSAKVVSLLYDEVTLRTSRLPIQFFDQNPVGRIVTRFSSDYGNIFRLFGGPLAELSAIVFDLIAMLVLVAIASPFYLPVVVFIGCLNYIIYRLNRSRLRRARRELSAIRSPAIAHFAETMQGASTIRIFSRQNVFFRRFSKLNDGFLKQRLKTTLAVSLFSIQMTAMTAMLLLITGSLGLYLLEKGFLSIGSIGVAFTFTVLSGSSLQMFFDWIAQLEEALTGVERLDNYLRRDLEPGLKLPSKRIYLTRHPTYAVGEEEKLKQARMVASSSASLKIENLWFRYSPDLPHVLKGIDLDIRAGEKIGIIGRTGSGKSTLVQALFHLYPFERGRVLLDNREPEFGQVQNGDGVERVDLGLFRRAFSLISQDPILFRGTLRENLDLAAQHTDADLIQALTRVGLLPWLKQQPLGLGAMIEERARNLSAGEKQLLCMARCLLQDAPVVVMDEATSSVDPQSEEILVRATREFFSDRTQIIIAHRLSTIDQCDRILWLHKGEVRMFDRPEKVLPVFQTTALA